MPYDLKIIRERSQELGFLSHVRSEDVLGVEVGKGIALLFQNLDQGNDCIIGFEGTPWHFHDDIQFADGQGYYLDMTYLDLLTALKDGTVLVAELRRQGQLVERWLIHQKFNDEFKYVEPGEEIKVFRAEEA
jgi:hypothetical protein